MLTSASNPAQAWPRKKSLLSEASSKNFAHTTNKKGGPLRARLMN